jgi:hypothetical protein
MGDPADADAELSASEPGRYHEVRLGANVRINALAAWRVFQIAMSIPPGVNPEFGF